MPDSPSLKAVLEERMAREGALPFSEFMEAALYHETGGYYSDPTRLIGRGGDFYTSVSVGPVFGELLSEFVAGVWEGAGCPAAWCVAEQGGHDGALARDVLAALALYHPRAAAATTWVFLEQRPAWRTLQKAALQEYAEVEKVCWISRPAELPPSTGLFLSNELVDALPVDLVCFREGKWWERRVGWEEGAHGFIWMEVEASENILASLKRLGLPEVEGVVSEVRAAAERWAGDIYRHFRDGVVLTMDYGDWAEELYGPARAGGTLRAYQGHQQDPDLLSNPGKKDLTAHVDFSLLKREGEAQGWRTRAFLNQDRFLVSLASRPGGWLSRKEKAIQGGPTDPLDGAALRQFRTLTHPELMGHVFRVLIQAHGRLTAVALPGLDFVRDGEKDGV